MLNGKIALITGTSRGIGYKTALAFAEHSAVVYANAREEGSLDGLLKDCTGLSGSIIPVYFDVTDTSAAKAPIIMIKNEEGRLDCLVNNAGIMQDALIGMINEDIMRKVFEVNVFAVIEMTQLVARIMSRQNGGSIINFASIAGVSGSKGQLAYSASKGAVISMTKAAAKELAPKNIRVNAVAPGMIDTDLFRALDEKKVADSVGSIGMGRLGTPEDVANVCVFLASDLSEYVTGQIIGVDGSAII